jgi:hypothetical protein
MSETLRIGVVSDIHYACEAEKARGGDYEIRAIPNVLLRQLVRVHRRFIWLRDPLDQGHLLDRFLERAHNLDYLVANGDYSCDSAFVGVSDEAARESARQCLGKLRGKFGERLRAVIGDHELGKFSLIGRQGGMRLASWRRATGDLALPWFWRLDLGRYTLLGFTSSLVALPVLLPDTPAEERTEWERLRSRHMAELKSAFADLEPARRLILFCHDPTALPFLAREEEVRRAVPQIEFTIIGHLHSNLVLRSSRILAGMPPIRFLGHTMARLSSALREARLWRPFNVRLCPALAGIEMLKDGGYCAVEIDPGARQPGRFCFHPIPRD